MTPAATILIPTWNSPITLRYAIASALRQTEENVEVLIVGDGVTEVSREVISTFQTSDERVVFLDLPKGENRGERNRHEGVRRSSSEFIVYLADDDIMMPRHVHNVLCLMESAPFVQSANTYIDGDNRLQLYPTDLSDRRWIDWHLEDPPRNRVSITGTAHTKALYARLDEGWNVAPPGIWTDLYLWRQFFRLPDFRGATHEEVTALQFPAPYRRENSADEIVRLYEFWYQFSQSPDGHERLQKMFEEAASRTLVELSAGFDSRGFQLDAQAEVIENAKCELDEQRAHIVVLQAEIEHVRQQSLQRLSRIERLKIQVRDERLAKEALEATLARVRSSVPWRLSRPLRWMRRKVLNR